MTGLEEKCIGGGRNVADWIGAGDRGKIGARGGMAGVLSAVRGVGGGGGLLASNLEKASSSRPRLLEFDRLKTGMT